MFVERKLNRFVAITSRKRFVPLTAFSRTSNDIFRLITVTCFLSAVLTCPVLGRENASFIANYFADSEIDQFNLLSSNGLYISSYCKGHYAFRQERGTFSQ